ncbi:hypothetical protein EIM50_22005, partial [Pseudoxanthomonas sp. SGD-10]
ILMLEGSFMDLYNSLGNDNTKWPVLELVYGDAVAPVITPSASNILFVNKAAAGNGTGNSWANAIPELADALKWARQNKDAGLWSSINPLKIYVAKGTYKPLYNAADDSFTTNSNRDNAFVMVENVQVYGGFASGSTDLATRNFTTNETILSGDLSGNDVIGVTPAVGAASITGNEENAYNVVVISKNLGKGLLDGFTIVGGNANVNTVRLVNDDGIPHFRGGGVSVTLSDAKLKNLIIKNNQAIEGGGINFSDCSVASSLANVTVENNSATDYGGGIFVNESYTSFKDISVTHNHSVNGGGLGLRYIVGKFDGLTISNNFASQRGGAIFGAEVEGQAILSNLYINNNEATQQAPAVYLENSTSTSTIASSAIVGHTSTRAPLAFVNNQNVDLTNLTIYNPSAAQQIYIEDGTVDNFRIKNSIILNATNTDAINLDGSSAYFSANSIISGNTSTANGNINATGITAANLFTNAASSDFTLKEDNAAVNAGDNTVYNNSQTPNLSHITKDLAGNDRIRRGAVDLG